MVKRKALWVVLWLALSMEMQQLCRGQDATAGKVKSKVEEARQTPADTMQDAKDKSDSWTDWAYGKFTEGFGNKQENVKGCGQKMMDKAGDAASRATETVNSAASDASRYATQKAGEAANLASENAGDAKDFASEKADQVIKMASDKAADAKDAVAGAMERGKDGAANMYNEAKEKLNVAADVISDQASDAKETVAGAMGQGKDKVADAYDQAKQKVSETYESAKDTMTGQAKANYEAAKEKASQATGDLGAKMRSEQAEL